MTASELAAQKQEELLANSIQQPFYNEDGTRTPNISPNIIDAPTQDSKTVKVSNAPVGPKNTEGIRPPSRA